MYFHQLRTILQRNQNFYLTFAGVWLLGLYYQMMFSQFALSIWINNLHTPILDWLMVLMTFAGDGIFLTVVGLVLILYKRSWLLPVLICLIIPSMITQILKHQLFNDFHRPSVLMEGISGLYFVPGVEINQFNSFPSGHTTAAFSLYTLLALIFQRKTWGWVWVVIASLVGLSRVYLLQHFWMDILAGALIGTLFCTLLFAVYQTFYPDNT